jgi:hypothetical protein
MLAHLSTVAASDVFDKTLSSSKQYRQIHDIQSEECGIRREITQLADQNAVYGKTS